MISSEEFAGLTYEEQVANLQRLGEKALHDFGVQALEIKTLVHFENTTFYVNSPEGEFNLRISRPGTQTLETIESEVHFLSALRSDGFRVPSPYQNRIVTNSDKEVPDERHSVLFHWMHGDLIRDQLTTSVSRLVGQSLAKLHEFVSTWERPATFYRAQLHQWLFNKRKPTRIDQPVDGLSEDDRYMLLQIEEEARVLVPTLPQTSDRFGLIHADLHGGNLLIEDGQLNMIDFDDCGFGYFYYDFGAALGFQLSDPYFQELKEAMLNGYEEVRPLPPQTRELIDFFIKLRMTGVSRWIMDRVDNPRLKEAGPEWVRRFCEGMRTLD